jgi:hypothetical protein
MSMRARLVSRAGLGGLLLAVACLAGCGGSDDKSAKAPLGSPENPVAAQAPSSGEAGSEATGKPTEPSFKKLVDRQSKEPARRDRDNPCAFVTKAQAQEILGARLLDPLVAPQGPTCIYRNRSGQSFATVAIQSVSFKALRRQVRRVERVAVSDRTAYCGMHGRPMLYLPLSGGRVLSVAAPCETATRFARRAAPRLLG